MTIFSFGFSLNNLICSKENIKFIYPLTNLLYE